MPIISALPNLPSDHERRRRLDDLEGVIDQLEVLDSDSRRLWAGGNQISGSIHRIYPMIPFTKMATVMLVSRNLGDGLCVKYNLANIKIFAHLYF